MVISIVISLADRVLGMRMWLGLLGPANITNPPNSWRRSMVVRGCVVHRSERVWQPFLAQMMDRDGWDVRLAVWDGVTISWENLDRADLRYAPKPSGGLDKEPPIDSTEPAENGERLLYVVAGFERFIVDKVAETALLDELEKLGRTRSGILMWSRMLPSNWLANQSDQVLGDLTRVSEKFTMSVRWGQVLGPFDVRRLVDDSEDVDKRFEEGLRGVENISNAAKEAMLREARANPELLNLAASIVSKLATENEPNRNLALIAEQRFAAAAASHFHALWAASSREERLQLLSMARGGFSNPTQLAPLNCLANRGLIAMDGVVRIRSEAFAQFIVTQLDHDSLLAWCQKGNGNIWKSIWPPILLLVVLTGAFFVSSTPEAFAPLAAILAAGLGAVPVVSSLLTGFQRLRPSGSE